MKIKKYLVKIKIVATIKMLKSVQNEIRDYIHDLRILREEQENIKFLYTTLGEMCYNIDADDENSKKEVKTMFTVFDIANWFLNKEPMTHKKLQKLCYYAQAWSYVFEIKQTQCEFEAWVHGPVNRDLWNKFKNYGYSLIPQNALHNARTIDSKEMNDVLNSVWNTYGDFTDFELENLTHTEEPWVEARKNCEKFAPSTNKLSHFTMKKYYSGLLISDGIGE